ncbi:MAG: glycosyltransferase [Patescibacteria group bacterium]
MKVSVCVTTFNEKKTIERLLESLILQTKKPSQIVIVDAGSTDETVGIIKKYKKVKLIIAGGASSTKGRNIAIKNSKYDIIVTTDAGCVADKFWLKRITEPFRDREVDMVAGFYNMETKTSFQKALAGFMGVLPSRFDEKFLPSTRSMAFRKSLWKRVGGFSENLKGAIDDTDFNYKVSKVDAKIVRVKNAIVEWGIPDNLIDALKKFYGYAKGDAEYRVFWNPAKGFKSHNIKVLLIFLRYVFGFGLLISYLFTGSNAGQALLIGLFLYLIWAYRKGGFWGIVLQFSSDIAVMLGFIRGILI